MNCVFRVTDEQHRTGRVVLRCERCNRLGLLPLDGKPANLSADCQAWPRVREWGHWAALCLAVVGLTQNRYLALKRLLGLAPVCNCDGRVESMNAVGERFVGR